MSRTFDILNKAQKLREKHQNDIDKKLTTDIETVLKDTESFVTQRANTIAKNMHQEVEQTEQSLQNHLQHKKTAVQANIDTMVSSLSNDTQITQDELKTQIQSLKEDLQTLSGLSQEVTQQSKLRKGLISANIVLVSIAAIFLITSICLGYVSKSKYNDITSMQSKVDYLQKQGGSLNIRTCDNQICVQIDSSKITYSDGFRVVKEIK